MNKYIKKIISGMLALSMFMSTIITSNAATNVNVSVNINPKIDIMLTSKDTNLNLSNFEDDIKTKLLNKGINTSNIKIQTIQRDYTITDANSLNFEDVVNNWKGYGALCWKASGDQIYMTVSGGYGDFGAAQKWGQAHQPTDSTAGAGWECLLVDPNSFENNELVADFTLDAAGNLHNGFCFNVTENADGTVNGYFFSLCHHLIANNADGTYPTTDYQLDNNGFLWPAYNSSYTLLLYKFDHWDPDRNWNYGGSTLSCVWAGSNGTNISPAVGTICALPNATSANGGKATVLAKWYLPRSQRKNVQYHVESKDGHILISMNNKTVADVYDNTYVKGSYGFWGCNCEQKASMYISNFVTTSTKTYHKTYKDVLTQPTWREDAKHVVVNVDDTIDETLTGTSTIGEILSRTLADDIHFVQWGTNTNKSASETFISRNDNKGLFIDNSNYNNAVEETANYIASLINQESSEQYITIGQDISFSVDPEEFKTGATSAEYPNGRWKINHEYKYFANNQGQSAESGVPTTDLNFNFDKPGKYNILFDDKLVKEVYVHRKPVADFTIEIGENNTLILNSLSYDLDSNENKGIAKETWYYKEASASEWTEGKLTEFDKTKIYMIKLEVEDYQGTTSYTTKYTGTGNPVSNFNYANNVVSKYKPLVVNNTSYDPEGYDIVEQNWVLKKNNVVLSTTSEPITDFNQEGLGEGKYTYTLTVKNSKGTISEAFSKSFTIEEDYGKPEVAIGQQGCDWKHSQAVSLEFSDNESEFKNWRYAFTTSPVAPATDEEWSDWSDSTESTVELSDVSGKYYLHIEAYDVANNSLSRAVGTYNLDNTEPIINDVKTQKDEINKMFIKVEATDEHSGIVGYAITKAEPVSFNLRTRTNVIEPTTYQESNILEVTDNGTYNVWVKDNTGNVTVTTYTIEDVNYIGKNTTVYAEVGCEFKVTIPKHIILSGSTKSGAYTVGVEGDIAGTDVIKVIPDESFALSSTNLKDVTAIIEQDKTEWFYDQILNDEFKIIGNGEIDATGISAGSWNGNFNFNIALEGDKVYKDSEPYVEYMDILYNYEVEKTN